VRRASEKSDFYAAGFNLREKLFWKAEAVNLATGLTRYAESEVGVDRLWRHRSQAGVLRVTFSRLKYQGDENDDVNKFEAHFSGDGLRVSPDS